MVVTDPRLGVGGGGHAARGARRRGRRRRHHAPARQAEGKHPHCVGHSPIM